MSFSVTTGETPGVVGESGCGKFTFARWLVGLLEPTTGTIEIEGKALDNADAAQFGKVIQYEFQDANSSLNPRKTIRQVIEAPLKLLHRMTRSERQARISEIFASVNLRKDFPDRYPHEFSGGQAQRIGIARALAAAPRIIVLDEPETALDVSVQAQVLNLLAALKSRYNLTYLFISHDLAVVEAVSDRVVVLYFGSVVEIGSAEEIFKRHDIPIQSCWQTAPPWSGVRCGHQNKKTASCPIRLIHHRAARLPDVARAPPTCAGPKKQKGHKWE